MLHKRACATKATESSEQGLKQKPSAPKLLQKVVCTEAAPEAGLRRQTAESWEQGLKQKPSAKLLQKRACAAKARSPASGGWKESRLHSSCPKSGPARPSGELLRAGLVCTETVPEAGLRHQTAESREQGLEKKPTAHL